MTTEPSLMPTIYPDTDPERTFLGFCLRETKLPDGMDGKLTPEDFSESYRLIARSIFATTKQGPCDVVAVAAEMEKLGAGMFAIREIAALAESAPLGPPNVENLITLIKARRAERDLVQPETGSEVVSAEPGHPITWQVLDAADYQAWKVEPVVWAVEPIITKDTIGYVGGLPKIGKSLVVCDLLLHVTHKKPWLGRYGGGWTPRWLYLAREDPIGRIQARIDEMQAGYGFPPIPQGMFRLLIRERFQLTEKAHCEWLISYCNGEGIDFLVLDVLGRMIRGKDQMDPADWGEIQDILEELNREHRLTIAMLDHARKPLDAKKGVSLSAMEIKGPVEKYGGADWSIVIGRTKEKGRLEMITEGKDTDERLRFLVDVAPMARRNGEGWEIRQPGGFWVPGHPQPKLTYAGDVLELSENRKEVGRRNREVVDTTIQYGERVQIGTVLERLSPKLSRSTVGAHLKALLEDGTLDSSGTGRNAWYWRREEASD